MKGLYVSIESGRIEDVAKLFAADFKQAERAALRALGKTLRWGVSRVLRELPQTTNIPRKILKGRVRVFRHGKFKLRLWVGGKPVAVSRLGPKQTKSGVSAKGGRTFPGAFVAEHMTGQPVFKRVSRDRLPIEFQEVPIADEVERVVWSDVIPHFEKRFFEIYEQELRWETTRAK